MWANNLLPNHTPKAMKLPRLIPMFLSCVALLIMCMTLTTVNYLNYYHGTHSPRLQLPVIPSSFGHDEVDHNQQATELQLYHRSSELLVALHIPKTGGSTLNMLLRQIFFEHEISPFSRPDMSIVDIKAFLNTPPQSWELWKVLYTHEDFSILDFIPPNIKPAPITLLREPLAHAVSCFFNNLEAAAANYKHNFEDFVVHGLRWRPGSNNSFVNYQVKWMAGISPGLWPESFYSPEKQQQIREIGELQVAKQNLLRMKYFGITDLWDQSMCLLSFTLQIPPIQRGSYLTHRISNPHPPINEDVKDTFYKLVTEELNFYKYALKIFKMRFHTMQDHLRRTNNYDYPSFCYQQI